MRFAAVIAFLLLLACNPKSKSAESGRPLSFTEMRYATLFGIAHFERYSRLFYLNGKDTVWSLRSDELKSEPKLALLSSVFAGFSIALGERNAIKAVDRFVFYSDSVLLQRFQDGLCKEIGEEGQLNAEQLLGLKPDVLIGSGFLLQDRALLQRLQKAGIQVLSCDNFKEQHPLARAEWLRFFGFLLNRTAMADSLFAGIERSYLALKASVPADGKKPLVLTDALYQDVWHVPGGKSYTAKLIADAGGDYVFRHKDKLFTYPLNLETVLTDAAQAEIWLHMNRYKTKAELLAADRRYALLGPFKSGRLFNNNKRENRNGGNDFWEMGVVRPDWVLADLIAIFSPAKISTDKLYFYTQVD